jgi:hypothetical protein
MVTSNGRRMLKNEQNEITHVANQEKRKTYTLKIKK